MIWQGRWLFAFLLLPLSCLAIDLKPWFGNDYEFEFRVYLLYQNYNSVETPEPIHSRCSSNDTFTTLNVAYPFKRYCGQFETTIAHTKHQSCRFDNFRISGGYQWMSDDQLGDPVSLVTSIILTEPLSRALHDLSSFHHGHVEGEFCISIGKKYGFSCSRDFLYRWWGVVGIGTAEEGYPWYRGDAAFEYKYDTVHLFRGFVNSLWGVGRKNLKHLHCFEGYGPIRHRSIDIGLRYSKDWDYWGRLSLQYARRVYAQNFPRNANLLMLEYYLPFGMQISTNY